MFNSVFFASKALDTDAVIAEAREWGAVNLAVNGMRLSRLVNFMQVKANWVVIGVISVPGFSRRDYLQMKSKVEENDKLTDDQADSATELKVVEMSFGKVQRKPKIIKYPI